MPATTYPVARFKSTMAPHPIDGSCLKFFQPGRTARPGFLIQESGSTWILFTHQDPFAGEPGYLVSTIWYSIAREKGALQGEPIWFRHSEATGRFSWKPTGCLKGF